MKRWLWQRRRSSSCSSQGVGSGGSGCYQRCEQRGKERSQVRVKRRKRRWRRCGCRSCSRWWCYLWCWCWRWCRWCRYWYWCSCRCGGKRIEASSCLQREKRATLRQRVLVRAHEDGQMLECQRTSSCSDSTCATTNASSSSTAAQPTQQGHRIEVVTSCAGGSSSGGAIRTRRQSAVPTQESCGGCGGSSNVPCVEVIVSECIEPAGTKERRQNSRIKAPAIVSDAIVAAMAWVGASRTSYHRKTASRGRVRFGVRSSHGNGRRVHPVKTGIRL